MRKAIQVWLLMVGLVLLAGCGSKVPEDDTISVDKKGRITCTVVEDFDKDFYDAEELEALIKEDIADYNLNFGQDHLTLKDYEVKDGIAVLQTQFDEAKYYADYSGMTLFTGTVAEARAEGYDLSGECMDANGSLTDLGSMEKADELKVLVLEEAVNVEVPGSIVCVSRAGNVMITDKKEASVQEAEQAFIIYK